MLRTQTKQYVFSAPKRFMSGPAGMYSWENNQHLFVWCFFCGLLLSESLLFVLCPFLPPPVPGGLTLRYWPAQRPPVGHPGPRRTLAYAPAQPDFWGDREDTKAEKRTDRYLDLCAFTENNLIFLTQSQCLCLSACPLLIQRPRTSHCLSEPFLKLRLEMVAQSPQPPCPLPLHYHPMLLEDTKLMSPLPLGR